MIAVLADTHGESDARLDGHTRAAVREADRVVHAGDFTTEAVLSAFCDAAERLDAVHGNADSARVRERLPASRVVEVGDARLVAVHGHEHGATALSLLGRQEGADVVISGHTHRPGVTRAGGVTLLNPGSHAEPRGGRAAHAELDVDGGAIQGRLCEPSGDVFETFRVPEGRNGEEG